MKYLIICLFCIPIMLWAQEKDTTSNNLKAEDLISAAQNGVGFFDNMQAEPSHDYFDLEGEPDLGSPSMDYFDDAAGFDDWD